MRGEDIAKLIERIYASPAAVIARARTALEDGKKVTTSKSVSRTGPPGASAVARVDGQQANIAALADSVTWQTGARPSTTRLGDLEDRSMAATCDQSRDPRARVVDIGEQARLAARRRERLMSIGSPLGLLLAWELAGAVRLHRRALLPGAERHHRAS